MALYERDFILRVIKQLVDAIARALGLAKEGKQQEAQALLEEACGALLGMDYRTLALVDGASAASLLGDPSRVFAFARLVVGMADVAQAAGDALTERQHCVHALELVREVLSRRPAHAEALALQAELLRRTSPPH